MHVLILQCLSTRILSSGGGFMRWSPNRSSVVTVVFLATIAVWPLNLSVAQVPCEPSERISDDSTGVRLGAERPSGPAIIADSEVTSPTAPGIVVGPTRPNFDGLAPAPTPRVAFVLSGGGAKGSFEMGAVQRLYEEGLAPSIVAGTSVGAINAVKLAEGGTDACTALFSIWRYQLNAPSDMWRNTELMNEIEAAMPVVGRMSDRPMPPAPLVGMYMAQQVKDWISLAPNAAAIQSAAAEAQSLYSLEPIRRTLERNLDPDRVATSNIALRIASVDLDSGRLCYAKEDSTLCCDGSCAPTDLVEATMASASIPVIFEPVEIEGRYYVDGGVREVVPLLQIIQEFDPETTFVVIASPIRLQGSLSRSAEDNKPNILDIAQRSIDLLTFDIFYNDLLSATGVQDWNRDYASFFDRDLHVIAPKVEVHDMMEINPSLIWVNIDYGWMVAADVLKARTSTSESRRTWEIALSDRSMAALGDDATIASLGGVSSDIRSEIAAGGTGNYLSVSMSPFRTHKRLYELASEIAWLRAQEYRLTRLELDQSYYSYREDRPGVDLGPRHNHIIRGSWRIQSIREIKSAIRAAVTERIQLGGDLPRFYETWHTTAAINCPGCRAENGEILDVSGWIWQAFPSAGIGAATPPS